MTTLQPILDLSPAVIDRVTGPYTCDEIYKVVYSDSLTHVSFDLQLMPREQPFQGRYAHFDQETIEHYQQVIKEGFSIGAYEEGEMVGMLIAEMRTWNSSLWVWEFHVAAPYRKQGIGRLMMEWAVEKSQNAGLRTIICETQNVNTSAIHAYRKLGFQMEGIDISYYSNEDYPNRDVAVFMKRRINPVQ